MRKYDYSKAIEIIGSNLLKGLTEASMGMAEDWWWTAVTVWEDGGFVQDLAKRPELAGIDGSSWATPAIRLRFEDGTEKLHPCYTGESVAKRPPMASTAGVGPLSGPAQDALPALTEAKP